MRNTKSPKKVSSPPITRGSFVVRVSRGNPLAPGAELSASIVPVDGLAATLAEYDVQLSDTVVGIISDLLVELVREDQGDGK